MYSKKNIQCFFYRYKGYCKYEGSCKFLHQEKNKRKCRYFLKNACHFGTRCWYSHEKISQPKPQSIDKHHQPTINHHQEPIQVHSIAAKTTAERETKNKRKNINKKMNSLYRGIKKIKEEIQQLKKCIQSITDKSQHVKQSSHKVVIPKLVQDQEESKIACQHVVSKNTSQTIDSNEKTTSVKEVQTGTLHSL